MCNPSPLQVHTALLLPKGPVVHLQLKPDRPQPQVIKRANDTEYGLAAAVWTKSLDRMQAVTRGVKAGTVWGELSSCCARALWLSAAIVCNFMRCSLLRILLCSCLPSPCLLACRFARLFCRGSGRTVFPSTRPCLPPSPLLSTVNTHHIMDAAVPFGGYKESGFGREHGSAILEHYTQAGGGQRGCRLVQQEAQLQRAWFRRRRWGAEGRRSVCFHVGRGCT